MILVSGRKSTGQLSTAVFRDGQWHLTDLMLEFRGRIEKLAILDKNFYNKSVIIIINAINRIKYFLRIMYGKI